MKKQSFENHIRYYTPHHFVYYPVILFLLSFSVYFAITTTDKLIWSFIGGIFIVLFGLGFMLRQHYALMLQNRIVRLELRYRYFSLTGRRMEHFEHRLKEEQLFALRFASDDELEELIKKTLSENLSGIEIKKAIKRWKGDYARV
ncbi:DUF6526 family protein [Flavobacterium aestuarii]|uniref:DUF6526 family protein n=1 Tax=Flavobacterium aestuarii TaxID=3149227 RepID=UPI0032B394B7